MRDLVCFKVTVICTNGSKNTTYSAVEGHYLHCEDGYLYVFAESPAEVQKIVKAEYIQGIERLGLGYSAKEPPVALPAELPAKLPTKLPVERTPLDQVKPTILEGWHRLDPLEDDDGDYLYYAPSMLSSSTISFEQAFVNGIIMGHALNMMQTLKYINKLRSGFGGSNEMARLAKEALDLVNNEIESYS